MKVGIVGVGAIGGMVAHKLDEGMIEGVYLQALSSRNLNKLEEFSKGLTNPVRLGPISDWVDECDLIIEAAGADSVENIARIAFKNNVPIMILSVGALIVSSHLIDLARQTGNKIHVPSGAIAGLDGIKAASESKISSVLVINRKPPESLKGAPGVDLSGVDLDSLSEPCTLYSGSVADGYPLFPANVNVAAAVSLAGIGPEITMMEVIADPNLSVNTHEVIVESEIGKMRMYIEGFASPDNPKTSSSTAFSVLAYLKKMTSNFIIGT
jgi:aspartate dehydrogenase